MFVACFPESLFEAHLDFAFFGMSFDELETVCLLSCKVYLLISGFWLAKEDVLLNGLVEEERLLHDIAHRVTQRLHIILRDIFPVNLELSSFDIVELKQ